MSKTLFLILFIAAAVALLPSIARAGITGPTAPQYVPVRHFTPVAKLEGAQKLSPQTPGSAASWSLSLVPVVAATTFFDRSPSVVLRKIPQVRVMFTQELAMLLRILGRAVQVIGILCGVTLVLSRTTFSEAVPLRQRVLRASLAATIIGVCYIAPLAFTYMGVQALGIDPFRL